MELKCCVALTICCFTSMLAKGQFQYTTNADGTLTLALYTGPGGDVTIPDQTNGATVTAIGFWAFGAGHCQYVTNLSIPNTIRDIGLDAFEDQYYLSDLVIPDSVVNISDAAFAGCYNLTNIVIGDGVEIIGWQAFDGCGQGYPISSAHPPFTMVVGANVASLGDSSLAVHAYSPRFIFKGNAPNNITNAFLVYYQGWGLLNATLYPKPGTSGWDISFPNPKLVIYDARICSGSGTYSDGSVCEWGPKCGQFNGLSWFEFPVCSSHAFSFVVEACTNLNEQRWFPIQTGWTVEVMSPYPGPPSVWCRWTVHDNAYTNHPASFYRVHPLDVQVPW